HGVVAQPSRTAISLSSSQKLPINLYETTSKWCDVWSPATRKKNVASRWSLRISFSSQATVEYFTSIANKGPG
ncbi:MAG: hypothetical protein VST67_11805, partial [Nitrospirota bacterium]|nr:hypothetical protein [Nitrospirota bacterium]